MVPVQIAATKIQLVPAYGQTMKHKLFQVLAAAFLKTSVQGKGEADGAAYLGKWLLLQLIDGPREIPSAPWHSVMVRQMD